MVIDKFISKSLNRLSVGAWRERLIAAGAVIIFAYGVNITGAKVLSIIGAILFLAYLRREILKAAPTFEDAAKYIDAYYRLKNRTLSYLNSKGDEARFIGSQLERLLSGAAVPPAHPTSKKAKLSFIFSAILAISCYALTPRIILDSEIKENLKTQIEELKKDQELPKNIQIRLEKFSAALDAGLTSEEAAESLSELTEAIESEQAKIEDAVGNTPSSKPTPTPVSNPTATPPPSIPPTATPTPPSPPTPEPTGPKDQDKQKDPQSENNKDKNKESEEQKKKESQQNSDKNQQQEEQQNKDKEQKDKKEQKEKSQEQQSQTDTQNSKSDQDQEQGGKKKDQSSDNGGQGQAKEQSGNDGKPQQGDSQGQGNGEKKESSNEGKGEGESDGTDAEGSNSKSGDDKNSSESGAQGEASQSGDKGQKKDEPSKDAKDAGKESESGKSGALNKAKDAVGKMKDELSKKPNDSGQKAEQAGDKKGEKPSGKDAGKNDGKAQESGKEGKPKNGAKPGESNSEEKKDGQDQSSDSKEAQKTSGGKGGTAKRFSEDGTAEGYGGERGFSDQVIGDTNEKLDERFAKSTGEKITAKNSSGSKLVISEAALAELKARERDKKIKIPLEYKEQLK